MTLNRNGLRPRELAPFALLLILSAAILRAAAPETVVVGNPNNSPDSTGYGAVSYEYRIGKFEVTNTQYCAFLNAVAKTDRYNLFHPDMAGEYGGITQGGASGNYVYSVKGGMANKPVNFVSWHDAQRYANWLSNGQGSSDTEHGTYNIGDDGRAPDHLALSSGKTIKWALPSENEWYKAAYYDQAKSGYWPYAVKGGGVPECNLNSNEPKDVGSYATAASPYGTFDQNGNVWEWNETWQHGKCGVRGGSFYLNDKTEYLHSSARYVSNPPDFKFANYGFRVVALGIGPIVEPTKDSTEKVKIPVDNAQKESQPVKAKEKSKLEKQPQDE